MYLAICVEMTLLFTHCVVYYTSGSAQVTHQTEQADLATPDYVAVILYKQNSRHAVSSTRELSKLPRPDP